MIKSFGVFISVFTLCCAACSGSSVDASQAGVTDELPADVQAQLDQLPADVRAQIDSVLTQFKTMFGPLDRDNDGAISRDELSAMSNLSVSDPRTGERLKGEAAIQSWMDRFDIDSDGKVEYPAEMTSAIVRELLKQRGQLTEQQKAEQ